VPTGQSHGKVVFISNKIFLVPTLGIFVNFNIFFAVFCTGISMYIKKVAFDRVRSLVTSNLPSRDTYYTIT